MDGWMGCKTRADDTIRHLPSFALTLTSAFLAGIPDDDSEGYSPAFHLVPGRMHQSSLAAFRLFACFFVDMYWSAYSNFTFRNSSFIDGHTVAVF